MADKEYLYPVNAPINPKHYKIITQGNHNGSLLRHIESEGPQASQEFRFGIQVESPNGQQMHVFGSHDDINSLASEIKRNPDQVMAKIRPTGKSPQGTFYLNRPANDKTTADVQNMSQNDVLSQLWYGDSNERIATQPVSRAEEERRDFQEHQDDLNANNEVPDFSRLPSLVGGE